MDTKFLSKEEMYDLTHNGRQPWFKLDLERVMHSAFTYQCERASDLMWFYAPSSDLPEIRFVP